ncbi:hypothetical protein V6N13_096018 [Hibiscus sabdariffa]
MAAYEGAGSMQWRKLFAASTPQSLGFYPPLVSDREMVIDPPAEVFAEGDRIWQSSMVIQFIGKPPNFFSLVRNFKLLWGKFGDIEIHSAGDNLVLVHFPSMEDCDWVLANGPWHIQNMPIILRKWQPNLRSLEFDMEKLPVLVHLSRVPLELFTGIGLSYIASALGNPLYMDSSVAVEVPWFPPRCTKCCLFGHTDKFCDHKKMTQQVWVPKAVVDRGKLPISPDMQLRSSDVVDPLEQGVVSEPTQVVDPVHVVESVTPVDKEQHVPDCGLVTQSPVDQVQVVISSSDQVVVSDCSNQFTILSESDSRLVREALKGVAELMKELKQANKNVPKGTKKGRKDHHNSR